MPLRFGFLLAFSTGIGFVSVDYLFVPMQTVLHDLRIMHRGSSHHDLCTRP